MLKRKVIQYNARDGSPLRVFDSIKEAQSLYHITHISSVCRRKRRTDGGFSWQYADESPEEHLRSLE